MPTCNVFLTFLFSLTIKKFVPNSWKYKFRDLVLAILLTFWRFYKFSVRWITGKSSIERLCSSLSEDSVTVEESQVEFSGKDVIRVMRRMGIFLLFETYCI